MLGRFLEYSLPTADIRASLAFYEKLGFTGVATGDVWPHPYAVVTDGRLHVGLHGVADLPPALTFVKPGLLKAADDLVALGIRFEIRRLGDDVFNELAWTGPGGHRLRMLEARTFSPGERRATDTSACGYFQEIALPCPDLDAGKRYFEGLGFVGMDEPDEPLPHVACTSDTVDVGLYEPARLGGAMLVFECDDVAGTLARLAALDVTPARPPAADGGRAVALLRSPEGTGLLLVAAA